MKSGGWQLKQLSSTRYSEIVFYVLTVVVSYSLYHVFSNTRAGSRFADKTRQALAFDQLRSRRTPIIASGYNGFCGSCSTPFIEPETSKFSSQLSA